MTPKNIMDIPFSYKEITLTPEQAKEFVKMLEEFHIDNLEYDLYSSEYMAIQDFSSSQFMAIYNAYKLGYCRALEQEFNSKL